MSDLFWRIGWNIRRLLFTLFGPAQLDSPHDPIKRLERERQERYKNREK